MTTGIPSQMIYSYMWEWTGIFDVFEKFFNSLASTDDIIKLDYAIDNDLLDKIKKAMEKVFEMPKSTITPEKRRRRWTAYDTLYGYHLPGKENFQKSKHSNKEFHRLFTDIMIEIFQGIIDQDTTDLKGANPDSLANKLNNLQKILKNHTYNYIQPLADDSALDVNVLRALLTNEKLMKERLNISATPEWMTLQEFGRKVGVNVARQTLYLTILADRMEAFLADVQTKTMWDSKEAENLYKEPKQAQNFKAIGSALEQVTGQNLWQQTFGLRKGLPVKPPTPTP